MIEGLRIATAMTEGPRALLGHAPLVILPDAGYSWRDYRAIMQRFGAARRVFALDWPGFGASARPAPDTFTYTPERYAALLGQWLDSLGIARAALLAHGLAAGVAVRYAVERPMRTLGLGLIGPLGFSPQGTLSATTSRALRSPRLLRLMEPAITSLALGPTTEATEEIERERRAERGRPEFAASLGALAALWRAVDADRPTLAALARQVKAPGLVARGALDSLCAAPEAQLAAESLGERGGLQVTLPEAGHLPHLQQPDRFFQALDGLIMTCEATMLSAN